MFLQNNMFGNNPNYNWIFFGMPMMSMNNFNLNNGMNNGGNNWKFIYENSLNIPNKQQNFSNNKINLVFKSTAGLKMNVFVDVGTSISDAILLFLKRCGKTELFNPNSGIYFLCNAKKLNIYDKTGIENICANQINPVIMVNDAKNLIGAKQFIL